jgi:hypothetical protein
MLNVAWSVDLQLASVTKSVVDLASSLHAPADTSKDVLEQPRMRPPTKVDKRILRDILS